MNSHAYTCFVSTFIKTEIQYIFFWLDATNLHTCHAHTERQRLRAQEIIHQIKVAKRTKRERYKKAKLNECINVLVRCFANWFHKSSEACRHTLMRFDFDLIRAWRASSIAIERYNIPKENVRKNLFVICRDMVDICHPARSSKEGPTCSCTFTFPPYMCICISKGLNGLFQFYYKKRQKKRNLLPDIVSCFVGIEFSEW